MPPARQELRKHQAVGVPHEEAPEAQQQQEPLGHREVQLVEDDCDHQRVLDEESQVQRARLKIDAGKDRREEEREEEKQERRAELQFDEDKDRREQKPEDERGQEPQDFHSEDPQAATFARPRT